MIPTAGQLHVRSRLSPRWIAISLVVLLALLLLWLNAADAWQNTVFGGDAGHRMNNAHRPFTRLGNRIWLPYLQAHIWLFYLLELPPAAFGLIPCFYAFLASTFLGLLSLRVIGRSAASIGFALLLVVSFARQEPFWGLSVSLYQEILDAAFFFLLLWAGALRARPGRIVWVLAAMALLVRETFWIYLLAWSLIHFRRILSTRKLWVPVLLLWAVPAAWLSSVPIGYLFLEGELPRLGAGWPLMINPDGPRTLSQVNSALASVWHGLEWTHVLFLVAGLAAVALASRFSGDSPAKRAGAAPGPLDGFPVFSLVALSIAYGLIVVFDPWEMTEGNVRQAAPLIEHAYVWAILLFHRTAGYPAGWRAAGRIALIAGVLASARPHTIGRRPQIGEDVRAAQLRIRQLAQPEPGAGPTTVCIADDYWQGVRRFVAPTLYARREFVTLTGPLPADCDLGIVREGEIPDLETTLAFEQTLVIEGVPYGIYVPRTAR